MSLSIANNSNGPVVLVVEDELSVRYDIAVCLREAGYVVIEAASGEEAIACCKSAAIIDIVFTDINLDGIADACDVGECFHKDRPGLPVLSTSAQSIRGRKGQPGRSVFVTKPYRQTEILTACARLRSKSTF
ncbi:MAG: response regulator [Xanthobacteraceae bacterium]|jgi:CheY-like chemotaxis protein